MIEEIWTLEDVKACEEEIKRCKRELQILKCFLDSTSTRKRTDWFTVRMRVHEGWRRDALYMLNK